VLLIIYRGRHCNICRLHLRELVGLLGEFAKLGVTVMVASCDDRDAAQSSVNEWHLQGLPLAYGLPLDRLLQWGLSLSAGRGRTGSGAMEPLLFAEPGLFLIRPDGCLQAASLGADCFSRPRLRELLRALDLLVRQQ
jgi:peroxiredoxin